MAARAAALEDRRAGPEGPRAPRCPLGRLAVPDPWFGYGAEPARVPLPAPSAADLALLDALMAEIKAVPDKGWQAVLALRLSWDPILDQPLRSWRAVGRALDIDHKTAAAWWWRGADAIIRRVRGQQQRR